MLVRRVLVTLALLAGCSDNSNKPMMAPPDMARAAMDHPPLWRMNKGTGGVQAAAEVWTVVWPGDEAIGADVADFVDWMLHSDYWKTSLMEYGVGAGTGKGLIVLPSAAPSPLGDAQVQQLVSQLVSSGQVTASDNAHVLFVPPATTTVTDSSLTGCSDFTGYHWHTGGASGVAYSINLRCTGEAGEPIDQLTDTISHEVAEAATDPEPRSGYVDASPGGQEVGDLCEFGLDVPIDVPPDATHPTARRYWLQRLYSDARAAMGTIEPCLPLPWDHPYWNVAVDPPVILAAPGSSAAIDARLDVFAYGDVGDIKWVASSSGADVSPSSGTAHAGDTIAISVTPLQALRAGETVEIDVLSEAAKGGSQLWMGYVQGRVQ
jgi:hypothetical protein